MSPCDLGACNSTLPSIQLCMYKAPHTMSNISFPSFAPLFTLFHLLLCYSWLQTAPVSLNLCHIHIVFSERHTKLLPRSNSVFTFFAGYDWKSVLTLKFCSIPPFPLFQTRMQSLQPDPAARYRNVMDALRRIVATEGVWRPMRGLNVTAVGAGPAHALYFASYEKLKKTLSDVIHPGANSHLANGTINIHIHM